MIFVDSNALIDLSSGREPWVNWSRSAVADACASGPVVINAVVFAELAPNFTSIDILSGFLETVGIEVVDLSRAAAYRAGQAFAAYRQAGGKRDAILADFLIGGHASALGAALLTRDRQRFAGYFPELKVIAPETNND
jgi:predicted nucleic acid-binding protein